MTAGAGSARRDPLWLEALPWLAWCAACAPLLRGFPQGHDWSFELVRVAEYGRALAAQWPPAWAGNLYGGYGSPIFLFYAPLYAFGSSVFSALAGVDRGAVAMLLVSGAVGVLAMRRLAWLATGSRSAARVAAAGYVLHPYLICDALLRNANAEYLALCIAPAVAAALLEMRERPQAATAWLAASLALLVLAHNLTALFTTGMLLVGAGALYLPRAPRAVWVGLASGIALGLALAAFFWLPAVAMTPLVRTDDLLAGKFDFHRQFPAFLSLFGYARFYAAGLLPLAVLGAGVAALRVAPNRRLLATALAGAAVALFLMTPASVEVWETVPVLPFFQFPWRLQGPLALLTSLVAALAFAALLRGRTTSWQRAAEVVFVAAALANALPHLRAARPLEPAASEQLSRMLSAPGVRAGSNAATVLDEYLPRSAGEQTWQRQRPGPGGVVAATGGAGVEVLEEGPTGIRLRVEAPQPSTLRLARWAFPGWELHVAGARQPVEPNPLGSIDAVVPAGTSELVLRYRAPPLRRAGTAVSVLAVLVGLGLAWRVGRR